MRANASPEKEPATSAVTHQCRGGGDKNQHGYRAAATLPQSKSLEESIGAALCATADPGAKPDCVVAHKRVISANASRASALQPSPGWAIHTFIAYLLYSQPKQTGFMSQTSNHSNNTRNIPLEACLRAFGRLKWPQISFTAWEN